MKTDDTTSRLRSCRFSWFPLPVLLALVLILPTGCGGKKQESGDANKFPPGVVEGTIQKRFPGQSVTVGKLTYLDSVPSKGGRVPAGVPLHPVKAQVTVGTAPEKEITFYFYQTPFGSWEAYME